MLRQQARTEAPPKPPKEEETSQTAQGGRDGSTLRVVQKIGETGRETRHIADTYRSLTQPMPLAGAGVRGDALATALELEFPWMTEAARAVRDELALRSLAGLPWFRLSPMLLVGPPGVGKTRLARRLAELAGTGYGELSVAGSSDSRMLSGTARGWSSAQPAYPLILMHTCQTANPVIVLDEVDKTRASRNGDIMATLLTLLERDTASRWFDECLLARCDLGEVTWILTANSLDPLPPPLLSRMRIVHVEAPEPQHFERLLFALLTDIARELSVTVADLPPLDDRTRDLLRRGFTRSGDVRRLAAAFRTALAHKSRQASRPCH